MTPKSPKNRKSHKAKRREADIEPTIIQIIAADPGWQHPGRLRHEAECKRNRLRVLDLPGRCGRRPRGGNLEESDAWLRVSANAWSGVRQSLTRGRSLSAPGHHQPDRDGDHPAHDPSVIHGARRRRRLGAPVSPRGPWARPKPQMWQKKTCRLVPSVGAPAVGRRARRGWWPAGGLENVAAIGPGAASTLLRLANCSGDNSIVNLRPP